MVEYDPLFVSVLRVHGLVSSVPGSGTAGHPESETLLVPIFAGGHRHFQTCPKGLAGCPASL